MSFLDTIWNSFKEDLKAIPPEGVKIYKNEESGEFAYEIRNRPNKYVTRVVRHYSNGKVFMINAGNGDETKCLEGKKDLQGMKFLDFF